jgi:hypothetical protein
MSSRKPVDVDTLVFASKLELQLDEFFSDPTRFFQIISAF